MEMLKGTKCAGKVHYNSSRHVPGKQNSSAQCGRGEQQLWGGGPTSEVGLHQGPALSPDMFIPLMDVLTEDVRKDVHGSMMFPDDIVLCGDAEADMTEYLETWRRPLEHRGRRISIPETQFINLKCGQDSGHAREPVKILIVGELWEQLGWYCADLSTSMKFGTDVDQNILNSFFEGAKAGAHWGRQKRKIQYGRQPILDVVITS